MVGEARVRVVPYKMRHRTSPRSTGRLARQRPAQVKVGLWTAAPGEPARGPTLWTPVPANTLSACRTLRQLLHPGFHGGPFVAACPSPASLAHQWTPYGLLHGWRPLASLGIRRKQSGPAELGSAGSLRWRRRLHVRHRRRGLLCPWPRGSPGSPDRCRHR